MKKKTKAMNEEKHDHEYEMIRRQTDNIMSLQEKLKKLVKVKVKSKLGSIKDN